MLNNVSSFVSNNFFEPKNFELDFFEEGFFSRAGAFTGCAATALVVYWAAWHLLKRCQRNMSTLPSPSTSSQNVGDSTSPSISCENFPGKRIFYSLGKVSNIIWDTPEGQTAIFRKGEELYYRVIFKPWDVETRNHEIKKKYGYLNLSKKLLFLSTDEQLDHLKNCEVALFRNGEPKFFEMKWEHWYISPHTDNRFNGFIEIKRDGEKDDLILETKDENKLKNHYSDRLGIVIKSAIWADEEFEKPPRGFLEYHTKKIRKMFFPEKSRNVPHIRTFRNISINQQNDAYLLARFKPNVVIRTTDYQRNRHDRKKIIGKMKMDNKFKVIFIPNWAKSRIDNRFSISEFMWCVSVICFNGPCGNHAQIIIEGVDHGKYFCDKAQFNGPYNVKYKEITGKDIDFKERSEIFKKDSESVTILIHEILKMTKNPPNKFAYSGRYGLFSEGADNCYTWAESVLKKIGIYLYQSPIRWAATIPRLCLSSDDMLKSDDLITEKGAYCI